jgi:hypothetical protein
LGAILVSLIAFISLFVPGVLLALALLKKTELHLFEIVIIGFIFGLVFPPTLTWLESYATNYIHFFSFSLTLFEINCLVLTIIGAVLCFQQGVFESMLKKEKKEPAQAPAHADQSKSLLSSILGGKMAIVWILLLLIMIITFYTRIVNIGVSPHYFEFDPYFDLLDAKSILTIGKQLYLDPAAWPVVAAGTNHRIQPLLPYLEAYWYDLANLFGQHTTTFSTNLMSLVSSVYPPITAALMVFVIFMLLYHEYNAYIGLIGAALTGSMAILLTTFIAGEQLLEPWGIFSLFFFFAAYMLAVKKPSEKRYAVLAGIAFATTFLGSHYFTVDTGILMLYILGQGVIDVFRNQTSKDFYKMNIVVIAVIGIFLLFYQVYNATPTNLNLSLVGVPLTFAGPALSLLAVAVLDYGPRLAHKWGILKGDVHQSGKNRTLTYAVWLIVLIMLLGVFSIVGPLHHSINAYLSVSKKFTSASSALFATVQEYAPTGLSYNYASAGLGLLAAEIAGLPLLVWLISAIALILIAISIIYRNSRTGVFYLAISVPLMYAGMKEAKYLPHFAAVYIMLFCIMLGELLLYIDNKFKIPQRETGMSGEDDKKAHSHWQLRTVVYAVGLFFVSTIIGIVYLMYKILGRHDEAKGKAPVYMYGTLVMLIAIFIAGSLLMHTMLLGESSSLIGSADAAMTYNPASPTASCNTMAAHGNSIGYELFCNQVPSYWINATEWMQAHIGPNAPRVLSWWDYGDWINWFGNTNAVLRGDNSVPKEDYATAAMFVLGAKDNYTATELAKVMNPNQTQYVLFDQGLVAKWGALDFLGCVDVNETSLSYAVSQGAAQNQPYVLGTSPCEINHDPQYVLVPYATLVPSSSAQQIQGLYCSISNATATYAEGYIVDGQSISNETVCVNVNSINQHGAIQIYNSSGKPINAVINANFYLGTATLGGQTFIQFLMIYLPNGPNGTITNAPSEFYTSTFYKGFFLGHLSGFQLIYPNNSSGINYVNVTNPIRIFKLINYTGGNPPLVKKLPWVQNNYTYP